MMRVVSLLLVLIAASPALATEPANCYTKIMPDFTDVSSSEDTSADEHANPFTRTDSEGRFMNVRLNQTRLLGSCGSDISKDIVFWTALYRSEGCSDNSPVARSFRWFWTVGIDELKAERKEEMRNAPRDSNGLVAMSYVRGFSEFCLYLHQAGAWHLSTEN